MMFLEAQYPFNPMPTPRARGSSGRHYNPEDYEVYLNGLADILMQAAKKLGLDFRQNQSLRLQTIFYRKNNIGCDIDNLAKAVMDALTRSAVIKDDRQITMLYASKKVDASYPRTEILIWEGQEEENNNAR